MLTRYSLPGPLLQGITNILNKQPAIEVRHLLNALEAECSAQEERARADEIRAAAEALNQQPKESQE